MLDVASPPIQRCMSSLSTSRRVRPKSPPLQPASATVTKSSPRRVHERRPDRFIRIGKSVSGMSTRPDISGGGDGGPEPYPLPVPCPRWSRQDRVRSEPQEGSERFPYLRA